jgi:hypothetical protein
MNIYKHIYHILSYFFGYLLLVLLDCGLSPGQYKAKGKATTINCIFQVYSREDYVEYRNPNKVGKKLN